MFQEHAFDQWKVEKSLHASSSLFTTATIIAECAYTGHRASFLCQVMLLVHRVEAALHLWLEHGVQVSIAPMCVACTDAEKWPLLYSTQCHMVLKAQYYESRPASI